MTKTIKEIVDEIMEENEKLKILVADYQGITVKELENELKVKEKTGILSFSGTVKEFKAWLYSLMLAN